VRWLARWPAPAACPRWDAGLRGRASRRGCFAPGVPGGMARRRCGKAMRRGWREVAIAMAGAGGAVTATRGGPDSRGRFERARCLTANWPDEATGYDSYVRHHAAVRIVVADQAALFPGNDRAQGNAVLSRSAGSGSLSLGVVGRVTAMCGGPLEASARISRRTRSFRRTRRRSRASALRNRAARRLSHGRSGAHVCTHPGASRIGDR
jgi:hypothetical protein